MEKFFLTFYNLMLEEKMVLKWIFFLNYHIIQHFVVLINTYH